MEFIYKVTQPATTYYRGNLIIEAENEVDAIENIQELTQEELEEMIHDWDLVEEGAEADGQIEVWNEEGHIINQMNELL